MGWWSAGIMGGDTPCDLEIEFYSLVGLGYEPTKEQIAVAIDDKVRELMLEWIPKDEWAQTDHKRKEIIDNLLEKVKNSGTAII